MDPPPALSKNTALITGASSGLGAEFAKLFAADGCDLVLIARRKERLERLAKELQAKHPIQVFVLAEDLSRPETPQRVFQDLSANEIEIDTVVNCAGFGLVGTVVELSLQRQLDTVEVNIAALTKLTRLFLPSMLERRRGAVLNVASTAAFQPGPNMATYYATKAYVLSFTEALAFELRGTGVKVSCVCPGPTATEFGVASGTANSPVSRLGTLDPAKVARQAYRGLKKGKPLMVPGLMHKLGRLVVPLLPRCLVQRVVGALHHVKRTETKTVS
jgi:short-subunit dehydrogenase